jgi:hypothetical protein
MKQISGPVNIIRLEGKINNIIKILHICVDIHSNINYQTKCENIRSTHISNFITNSIDKQYETTPDMMLDMFIERDPLVPNFVNKLYKGRYLDEILHLFNKTHGKELFINCRFHYTDIRSYFVNKLRHLVDSFNNTAVLIWKEYIYTKNQIINLKDCLLLIKSYILFIHDTIYSTKYDDSEKIFVTTDDKLLSSYTEDKFIKNINYILNKISNKYDNITVKNKINEIIVCELNDTLNSALNTIEKYIIYYKNVLDKYSNITSAQRINIIAKNMIISGHLYDIIYGTYNLILSDIFFLRRFLDKSYITNSLLYTGLYHGLDIIMLLCKHISYFEGTDDIDTINNIVKKTKKFADLKKYVLPKSKIQCCILNEKFPLLFL